MWRIILAFLVFVMLMAAPTAVLRCQLNGMNGETAVDPCTEGFQQLNTHLAQTGISAVELPVFLIIAPLFAILAPLLPPLRTPGQISPFIFLPPPRLV